MDKEVFDRLLTEFKDLNDKALKLRNFILDKDKFEQIDNLNRDLLVAQLKSMESYLSVLTIRIGLNSPKDFNLESNEKEVSE